MHRFIDGEAQRNIELMWLTGRLAPDFKTIADFRKDNGAAIQSVCRQFVELCRRLKLFTGAVVAIDGSKFKAVNNRDKNYTVAKVTGRMEQATGCGKITALADRGYFNGDQVLSCEGTGVVPIMPKTLTSSGAKRGFFTRQDFIYNAEHDYYTCPAGAKLTKANRRADHTEDFDFYRHLSACFTCPLRPRCTPTKLRRIKRWVNEDVLDRMQDRLDRMPEAMGVRRQTVEHPFGTLKAWMGATHFLTRTLDKVRTEISLHVLAYNIKRMITIFGVGPLMEAIRT